LPGVDRTPEAGVAGSNPAGAQRITLLTWDFSPKEVLYSASDSSYGAVCVSGRGVDLPNGAQRISAIRHGLRAGHLVTDAPRLRLGRGVLRGDVGMRYKPGGGLGDRPIRLGQQTRTERDKVPAAPYPRRRYRCGCRTGSVVRWPVPVPWRRGHRAGSSLLPWARWSDGGRQGVRERDKRAGRTAASTLNPTGSGPQHSVREVLHDGRDGGPGVDA
jgi:hypothetical protein